MTRAPVDVAVIGGGPAGATAARLLREWGHEVVLIHRASDRRPPLAVSIPPSTRKILAAVGALASVEAHGFLRTTGNTSWWGTDNPRVEPFPDEGEDGGFQVLRADLEGLLLREATSAGVAVREGRGVRDVRLDDTEGARLLMEGPAGHEEIRARQVLDASGRAGVVARRGFREKDGPVTLALAAVWHRDEGFPVADDSHTLVEAYADGWAWSVPVARGLRHVTVMIDPPLPAEGLRDLAELYARELRKASHLEAVVAAGARLGPPWAADASTYGARDHAAPRLLLVGDAGSFIDPLSSYGVKKALASAWLAAVATHTALRHPEREEMARTFFSRREMQMQSRYAHDTARYAAEAALRHSDSTFWKRRAAPPAVPLDHPDAALAAPADVARAFAALKSRRGLVLALGPGVCIAPAPLVRGHEIVSADALQKEGRSPVHFVGSLHATAMALVASRARGVGALFEGYNAAAPPVALGEFLHGLATLVASGLFQHEVGPRR